MAKIEFTTAKAKVDLVFKGVGKVVLTWGAARANRKEVDLGTSISQQSCSLAFRTFSDRQPETVIVNGAGITAMWCDSNEIVQLRVMQNDSTLTQLNCRDNLLTKLDVSPLKGLTNLEANDNKLASVNVRGCTALESLDCSDNKLASLNARGLSKLKTLACSGNDISSLTLTGCDALTTLSCYGNKLATLNLYYRKLLLPDRLDQTLKPRYLTVGFTKLEYLYCQDNEMKTLNVSRSKSLKGITCSKNNLATLDVSDLATLTFLSCHNNKMKTLTVKGCSALRHTDCLAGQDAKFSVVGLSEINSPLMLT